MRLPVFSRAIRSSFLCLIWSVYGFKPMREKELFLCWQKRFRGRNDRAQRRCHLKTDQDKDEAPDSEMTFASRAKKTVRRIDQTQAKTDTDDPKEQVQRAHESD